MTFLSDSVINLEMQQMIFVIDCMFFAVLKISNKLSVNLFITKQNIRGESRNSKNVARSEPITKPTLKTSKDRFKLQTTLNLVWEVELLWLGKISYCGLNIVVSRTKRPIYFNPCRVKRIVRVLLLLSLLLWPITPKNGKTTQWRKNYYITYYIIFVNARDRILNKNLNFAPLLNFHA